jgi:hypothetical protein
MPNLALNLNSDVESAQVAVTGPCTVHQNGLPAGKRLRIIVRQASGQTPKVVGTLRSGPLVVDMPGDYQLSIRGVGLVATDSVNTYYQQ